MLEAVNGVPTTVALSPIDIKTNGALVIYTDVVSVLSVVPEVPVGEIRINIAPLLAPVAIPELRYKIPPPLLVEPEVAPPAWIVKLLPAVLAVVCLSKAIVLLAPQPKDQSVVGAAVPIPTLAFLVSTLRIEVSPSALSN